MPFASFPLHRVPRMILDTKAWNVFAERMSRGTKEGVTLICGPLWIPISRMAPLMHHQPFTETQSLPSTNPHCGWERTSNTNNRDQRVTEKFSEQTSKWQPRKEGIVLKTISWVLKGLEQGRIVLLPPLQEFTFWACPNASYMLLRIQWLNPTSSSHKRGLQCSPPTNFGMSGLGPRFSTFSFSDPPLAVLPPFHSFWPTLCSLLPTREWAEVSAVQKLLNNMISREPVTGPISRWLPPLQNPPSSSPTS